MSQEKKEPQGVFEMSDAELEGVNGGVEMRIHETSSGKKYVYSSSDKNGYDAYLCPKCRVVLYSGPESNGTYKCPLCHATFSGWCGEIELSDSLNLASGHWVELD